MSQASFELRESRWSEGLDTYAPTIQAFADHLAGLDYRAYTVMRLASAARHFCVWLQLSKVIARCKARLRCLEPFNIGYAIKDTPTEFQKRRPLVQISPTLKGTDA